MITCAKLVSGGPCMRTPGHGGNCYSGHLIPVEDPSYDTTGNPFLFIKPNTFWRLFWQVLRQRDAIRTILIWTLFALQVGIDIRWFVFAR